MLTGADLKERAQMSNPEAELFVHGLRALMNDIGETWGDVSHEHSKMTIILLRKWRYRTLNSDNVALKR